jgi:hypothetical protein
MIEDFVFQGSMFDSSQIPDFIDPDLWSAFLQHRKEIRHKVTPTTKTFLLKKLQRWNDNGVNVNLCIERSIEHGWQGIFQIKEKPVTDGLTVPKDNELLWPWAKKHGFPDPGSKTFNQYRRYLEGCLRNKL